MFNLLSIGVYLGVVSSCLCQHYSGGQSEPQSDRYNYNTQPPPQILTHKQALNHDGNFKYLFTSENGLAQGESIAPDGSRNGGYSYVDPTGRKISVKYTAGKEGFRILEADHLPKAPLPVAPLPVPQQQAAYAPQGYNLQRDDGQYRPEVHERPYQQQQQQPQQQYYNLGLSGYSQPKAYSPQLIATPSAPISNSIGNDREPEYNDAPGKANSFGNGYIFEFSG